MLEKVCIVQDETGLYHITRVLEFEKYIGNLPKTFWSFAMNLFKEVNVSIEFMMNSVYGKHFVEIIVRGEDFNKESAVSKVDGLTTVLLEYLKKAGCHAYEKDVSDISKMAFHMQTRENLLLCVPGERQRGISFCYVPGGYDMTPQIDLNKLWSIIQKYSDSGMNIQCNASDYTEEEKYLIKDNIAWLNNQLDNSEVAKARHVYQMYAGMSFEPIYFMNLTIWGKNEAVEQIIDCLKPCGFDYIAVPDSCLKGVDYYVGGHKKLVDFAIQTGHSVAREHRIEGLSRLNFLTNLDTILKILGGMKIDSLPTIIGSPEPDLTKVPAPVNTVINMQDLDLGMVEGTEQKITVPWDALSKHMVIAGMPGCGKTTMVFHILSEAWQKKLPFIVIEPTKTEYRSLIAACPDLKVYTPGRTDLNPIMLNPFLPPKGITLEQYLPSLVSIFQMAFVLTSPLNVIILEVIRNCYVKYGWRSDSTVDSPEVTIFGMHEFINVFKDEINRSSYDPESKQNLLTGGAYRFQAIINDNPYLFDTDKSMDIEKMLSSHTLIELDAIDNTEQRALILNLILLQIKLVIRKNQEKDGKLKNLILMDEAHVLLGQQEMYVQNGAPNTAGKLVEFLLDMVKVNRAYGTGMIFSDQSLSIMEPFFDFSDIKIAMRMETAKERAILANSLSSGEEIFKCLPDLGKGEFILVSEETKAPIKVKSYDTRGRLSISTDVEDDVLKDKMKPVYQKPFRFCPCKKECDIQVRTEAEYIARQLYLEKSGQIKSQDMLDIYIKKELSDELISLSEGFDNEKKLQRCAFIMTERMLRQKINCED